MKKSCCRKIKSFLTFSISVAIVFVCIFLLMAYFQIRNDIQNLWNEIENIRAISGHMAKEIVSTYNLADQVSASLDIIAAGIGVFALFGGILSVFNIMTAKELDEAISKADKALENQQELTAARLLQEGRIYVSRNRVTYAVNAFNQVVREAPNTISALIAKFEILSIYADMPQYGNMPEYMLCESQQAFDDLMTMMKSVNAKKDSEIYRHLLGDACFTLGCAYGQYAISHNPPDENEILVAEQHLKEALRYDNRDVEYHKNLAFTYALAGSKDKCRRELETALDCAEREPLCRPLVSQDRLRKLFAPIWESLSQEMKEMLNDFFVRITASVPHEVLEF